MLDALIFGVEKALLVHAIDRVILHACTRLSFHILFARSTNELSVLYVPSQVFSFLWQFLLRKKVCIVVDECVSAWNGR